MIIPIIELKENMYIRVFDYNTITNKIEITLVDPHTLLPVNRFTMDHDRRVQI